MAESNVLSKFLQKTGTDPVSGNPTFVQYPVGTEAKFVGAQRSSHNNNLEEQLMMGTDYQNEHEITEDLNGNIEEVETILFRKNNGNNDYDSSGYYKLVKTTVSEPVSVVDAANKKLTLNLCPKVLSKNEVLTYFSLQPDESVEEIQVSSKGVSYVYDDVHDTFDEHSHISNLNYEPVLSP